MSTQQTTVVETALPLVLTIAQEGVGGVTGQAPVVALRDGATLDFYLDFADNTFKNAGWVTRQAALAEVSAVNAPGTYQRTLDVSVIVGIAVGMQLVAEYSVNASPIIGVDHDVIEVVDSIVDVAAAVWDEPLAAHLLPGSTGEALAEAATGGNATRISFSATAAGTPPGQIVTCLASLVRAGVQVVAGLIGATCTMRTPDGVGVFGPLPMAAEPNGYFSLTVGGLSLTDATNYNFEVTIVDAVGAVTEFTIGPTIGAP